MDGQLLIADLEDEEGYRGLLYDDKTGKPLRSGDTIQGNPTICMGWNTAGKSMSLERSRIITGWLIDDAWSEVQVAYPWAAMLSEPRQRAMTDLCFQLGIEKFNKFNTFLSLMGAGRYDEAAQDLESTAWWNQVGKRGPKIQALIRGNP
jgi:GH24 family phage-related lysozyme (muramidase)